MNEFDFMLEDRIAKIQAINKQYDLEHNAYISFSGGKDSTILHYLIDLALPNNKIPRVFVNTGMEYKLIRVFVENMRSLDERILIINSKVNIKKMLNEYGYPFKSKPYSQNLNTFQRIGEKSKTYHRIKEKGSSFSIPNKLKSQWSSDYKIKISDKCCYKLKKEIAHKYQVENNKTITITGMRKEEGGNRVALSCLTNNNTKFHPLSVVNEQWEEWFVKKYNIRLCDLYYEPYNFIRTGCKGCVFNLNLQKDLEILYEKLPNEYKQCILLWKPIYDEYIRLGFRLKYYPHEMYPQGKPKQLSIFDLENKGDNKE